MNNNINPDKKTIMIVDDTESMRLLIASYLENDYNLILQPDGHEALLFLRENIPPDLILLDMEMPNINGRVFLRRVKIMTKLSKIPIIFITTVNSRLIVKSAFSHGVSDYIFKPFEPSELITKVKAALDNA